MKKKIHVIILEGPAGGGKTTLGNVITSSMKLEGLTYQPISLPMPFEAPRSFHTVNDLPEDYGTAMAHARDFAKISSLAALAVSEEEAGRVVYVLDRWLFSSLVYGRIRQGGGFDDAYQKRQKLCILHMLGLAPKFVSAYVGRHPDELLEYPVEFQINFLFVVNMPDEQEIISRRLTTTREFPHSAEDEIIGYNSILSAAKSIQNDPLFFEVYHKSFQFNVLEVGNGQPFTIDHLKAWHDDRPSD